MEVKVWNAGYATGRLTDCQEGSAVDVIRSEPMKRLSVLLHKVSYGLLH